MTSEELQARTEVLVDRVIQFIVGLPDTAVARRMAGQLEDAATSVGANYRAARRVKSHADFVPKIGIVSEEMDETVYWLERVRNAGIRSANVELAVVLEEATQLASIFGASHRTAKGRRRPPARP